MKIERLRELREKRGISQGEAAKRMGIVRTTYSNYEAGNREPDLDTVIRIADFFDVSVDYLLDNDSNKPNIDQAKKAVENVKYSKLSPEKKKLIDDMIDALLKE